MRVSRSKFGVLQNIQDRSVFLLRSTTKTRGVLILCRIHRCECRDTNLRDKNAEIRTEEMDRMLR